MFGINISLNFRRLHSRYFHKFSIYQGFYRQKDKFPIFGNKDSRMSPYKPVVCLSYKEGIYYTF